MKRAVALVALSLAIAEPVIIECQPNSEIDVFHIVDPIAQSKTWGCWATTAAMLWAWKNVVSMSEEDLTSQAGPSFRKLYDANRGISPADEAAFYKQLSLRRIQGQSPSIEAWADLLKQRGPLSITVVNNDDDYHALVLFGLKGDSTADGTVVSYIDPDGGKKLSTTFREFTKLYEGAAAWPLQIIYWP